MRHAALVLLLCAFVGYFITSEAHQVRIGLNFCNFIPSECSRPPPPISPPPVPEPLPPLPQTFPCEELNPSTFQRLTELDELLKSNWRSLDKSCSPRAPFALWLTQAYSAIIPRLRANWFECPEGIANLLFVWAQGYFDNDCGNSTAGPWSDCCSKSRTAGRTTNQDFMCFLNVFFTYELPQSIYKLCLSTQPKYRQDYNALELILNEIRSNTTLSFMNFYDPVYQETNHFDLVVAGWKSAAWDNSNALRKANSTTVADLATATRESLKTYDSMTSGTTGAARAQYCTKNPRY